MSIDEFSDAAFASRQGLGIERFVDEEKRLAVAG